MMDYKKAEWKPSPNYWRGRSKSITKIAIHHWGSPTSGYSHNGVVNTLINPKREASAHYVISDGRVTQLVRERDTSWATNSANPYTISLEIDPRCELRNTTSQKQKSDKIYATAADVIADIRRRYKTNFPLVPHSQFKNTACPGDISLSRLNKEAKGDNMATSNEIKLAYNKVLFRQPDSGGAKHYADMDSWKMFENMAVSTERKNLENLYASYPKTIASLKTALANEKAKPPEVVVKEVEKIVEKIVEVEKKVEVEVLPKWYQRVPRWITDLLKSLFGGKE